MGKIFASAVVVGLVLVLVVACPPPPPVVLVVMGDTQSWSSNGAFWYPDGRGEFPSGITSLDTWIQTNEALCARKAEKKIAGVVYVGDVVDTAALAAQWQRASQALDVLDACELPYYLIPGNHDDVNGDWTAYLDFFDARLSQPDWVSPSGLAHLTSLGRTWFLLGAPFPWLTAEDVAWYDATIGGFPNARVIVAHHDFISRDSSFTRPAAEAFVDARPEIKAGAYGHWCCSRGRRTFHETPLPSGGSVVSLYNNDQHNTTLHGWSTWLELRPNQICMEAWHPVTDQRGYLALSSTDPDVAGQTGRGASPSRTCFDL